MSPIRISLSPRDAMATAVTTCSEYDFEIHIEYERSFDTRTPMQRRIEGKKPLSSTAGRVILGGVELYYSDELHLSEISLFENFNAAEVDLALSYPQNAPHAWLIFPDLGVIEWGAFNIPVPLRVHLNRDAGLLKLILGEKRLCRPYELADGLVVGVDALGDIGEVIASGVTWTIGSEPLF
jgi:hypothetical protein